MGQISPEIAQVIKRQSGHIVLCEGDERFGLQHIEARHAKEIQSIGINACDFVNIIAGGYNQIRVAGKGKLLLVKKNGTPKVAVIELRPFENNPDNWTVVTAYPIDYKRLEKKELLWVRAAPEPTSLATDTNNLTNIGRLTKPKPKSQAAIIQSNNTNLGRIGVNAMEARQKGFFVENGYKYERQEAISNKQTGKATEIYFTLTVQKEGVYALISADDVQPSHLGAIENPKHFLPDAQPRNRATSASGANTPKLMAENLRPAEIIEGATAYTGCPIINTRGEVIQGNGRAYAIKYYWESFQNDPKGYLKFLGFNKGCYGFSKIDASIKHPVLVRMIDVSDQEAIRFGQYKQADTEAVSTKSNEVKAKVSLVSNEQLESLLTELFNNKPEDVTLSELIRGSKVLQKLVRLEVLRSDDLENYTKKGIINEEGVKFVTDFLVGLIFKNQDVNTPEIFKILPTNIQNIIAKSAVYLLRLEPQNDIRKELSSAIVAARDFINSSAKSLKEWGSQYDIFGKTQTEKYDFMALVLAKSLVESSTQKEAINRFAQYTELVNGKPADPMGLFPAVAKIDKTAAFKKVFYDFGKEYFTEKSNQNATPKNDNYQYKLRLAEAEAQAMLLLEIS